MSAAANAQAGKKGGEEGAAQGKGGGKKKLLLLAAPLLLAGIGAGLWVAGVLPHLFGRSAKPAPAAEAAPPPPIYADIPEIITNLDTGGRRQSYVKLHARLELEKNGDKSIIEADMPRLLDLFQTYLREMHPEELRSSSGTWRLREELLARAQVAAPGAHIRDVLFVELLIQ
jgi:flagellar FliL protein